MGEIEQCSIRKDPYISFFDFRKDCGYIDTVVKLFVFRAVWKKITGLLVLVILFRRVDSVQFFGLFAVVSIQNWSWNFREIA